MLALFLPRLKKGVIVNQAVPLTALQDCGPKGALVVMGALGEDWDYFAGESDDPVAIFWDTRVATIIQFGEIS